MFGIVTCGIVTFGIVSYVWDNYMVPALTTFELTDFVFETFSL
jgi:hypothetical protein